jgi:hypothetical protein
VPNIASYYVLFAVMGASGRTLVIEIFAASGFLLFAILGFKTNLWLVVAAIVGHGCFDFVHHLFIENPGVPRWWPGFCLAFDVIFGGSLAVHSDEALYTFAQPGRTGSARRLAQGSGALTVLFVRVHQVEHGVGICYDYNVQQ